MHETLKLYNKKCKLGIYEMVNTKRLNKPYFNTMENVKTTNFVLAGKVKNQTPRWECSPGLRQSLKPHGRAGKRMKYNKLFNNIKKNDIMF